MRKRKYPKGEKNLEKLADAVTNLKREIADRGHALAAELAPDNQNLRDGIEFSFVTAAVSVLLTAVLKHEGPDGFAEWVRRVTQLVIDHADPLHTETHAGPDGKGH